MINEFMNFKEALVFLSVSRSTLYKLTSSKGIKFYKPKGKIFFKKDDLVNFITQVDNSVNESDFNIKKKDTDAK